jgi:hypothetical protein
LALDLRGHTSMILGVAPYSSRFTPCFVFQNSCAVIRIGLFSAF